jgi:hypothetical protein
MKTTRAAILVATSGLAVGLIWGVTALVDQVQRPGQFARTALPGQVQVELTQPGPHVIYHEVAPDSGPTRWLPASEVDIRDPDGAQVPVEPYSSDLRYDYDGVVGRAVGLFSAPRTGTYLVTVAGRSGVSGAIAVGDDLAPGVIRAIVLPALTAGAALAVAALIVLRPATARRPEPVC